MAMGEHETTRQGEFWIPAEKLPQSPGHPFYKQLNRLLESAGFDRFCEQLCRPFYADAGRDSIPPGVYFRMLFVGYFEGLNSQRGIAWRCADSRSLAEFLGFGHDEATPEHSSLTRIRKRLSEAVHEQVFAFMLRIAVQHKLYDGTKVAVDSTLLEADAAMKSIVRKDTGKDWKQYLTELTKEAGIAEPTAEDLARFDRKRENKKVSNQDWESATDPDARIAKMKDGTTHLAYKAENAVDVSSGLIVAATVHSADVPDGDSLQTTLVAAEVNRVRAGAESPVVAVAADKGYHKAETLATCQDWGIRTYIPERRQKSRRRWKGKPTSWRKAFHANRRRVRGQHGRRLQRLRSEYVERSFAHMCETGGARRTRLRGVGEVNKRWLMQAAAHNLGVVMRKLFGVGTPRSLQGGARGLRAGLRALVTALRGLAWALCALGESVCRQIHHHIEPRHVLIQTARRSA